MNLWLYTSIVSFMVFLSLVDWKSITRNLWAGFICMAYQLAIHIMVHKLDYWYYKKVDYGMPNLIIFSNFLNIFFISIAFTMGILYVQFLPRNLFLQLIHAAVWTFFFRLAYYIAEQNSLIIFIHWKSWMYFYIIPINFIALAWIKNTSQERIEIVSNENYGRNSS
jgi:hypothetical protein